MTASNNYPCQLGSEDTVYAVNIGNQFVCLVGDEGPQRSHIFLSPEDARDLAADLIKMANGISLPVIAQPAPKKEPQRRVMNLTPLALRIYRHMERAGSISAREAMSDIGITSASLARRICDIEAEGFEVSRERRVHPITQQPYTRYSLAA